MKLSKITISIVVLLLAIGVFVYLRNTSSVEGVVFPAGQIYESSKSSLVFEYPKNLTISTIPDPDGEMILLSNKERGGVIQIYITKGENGLVVTPEILKNDIPELKNTAMILVDVNPSTRGVLFSEESTSNLKNLWFALGDKVYQMSFFSEFEETVMQMASSLKVKE